MTRITIPENMMNKLVILRGLDKNNYMNDNIFIRAILQNFIDKNLPKYFEVDKKTGLIKKSKRLDG